MMMMFLTDGQGGTAQCRALTKHPPRVQVGAKDDELHHHSAFFRGALLFCLNSRSFNSSAPGEGEGELLRDPLIAAEGRDES